MVSGLNGSRGGRKAPAANSSGGSSVNPARVADSQKNDLIHPCWLRELCRIYRAGKAATKGGSPGHGPSSFATCEPPPATAGRRPAATRRAPRLSSQAEDRRPGTGVGVSERGVTMESHRRATTPGNPPIPDSFPGPRAADDSFLEPVEKNQVPAILLDGKQLASELRLELASQLQGLVAGGLPTPHLVAVLVGDDPASQVYVRNKHRACEAAGLRTTVMRLPADTSQAELEAVIAGLNADATVHGILVQLPLPKSLDTRAVLDAIHPEKDVDGFHPINAGLLAQGRPRFVPCTPLGVLELLHRYQIDVRGRHAVVVGRSDIVGKPMALLLSAKESPVAPEVCNAIVTIAHSQARDLRALLLSADLIVAAVGQPEMIRGDMVRPGSVVIDVGINRKGDTLVGDVHFSEVSQVASAITPVPGGVGPLTIAMLLRNTVTATLKSAHDDVSLPSSPQ